MSISFWEFYSEFDVWIHGIEVLLKFDDLIFSGGTIDIINIHEPPLSAWYWGELQPNSPTYARFPNLLYTAELLCIKQNKNKPPYVNSPCHKVADAGNSTSSFSISAILHSCILGYSCFFI